MNADVLDFAEQAIELARDGNCADAARALGRAARAFRLAGRHGGEEAAALDKADKIVDACRRSHQASEASGGGEVAENLAWIGETIKTAVEHQRADSREHQARADEIETAWKDWDVEALLALGALSEPQAYHLSRLQQYGDDDRDRLALLGETIKTAVENAHAASMDAGGRRSAIEEAWGKWDSRALYSMGVLSLAQADYVDRHIGR